MFGRRPRADADAVRSRLRLRDVFGTASLGLRSRPGRTTLTALGISIGVASMIAVLGISVSSKADLIDELDSLGTNLLEVRAGQSVFGDQAQLPVASGDALSRVGTVASVAPITGVSTSVQRNEFDDSANGLDVYATNGDVVSTLGIDVATGRFFDGAQAELPLVVLGSVAAERLGLSGLEAGPTVSIAGRRFHVVAILESMALHPDLDRAVFIGDTAAEELLGIDPNPTRVYVRVDPEQMETTRAVLARTANPSDPNEVEVARPSDVLEARSKVDQSLQNLLLALGGVALLVGGVGIANVMVISVLERRSEIGLRRALGARRVHISSQFVVESSLLSALGGVGGVVVGAAVTWVYADRQGWRLDVPLEALAAGVVGSLALGALAGLYPAIRASRLDPADAIRPSG